MTRTVLLRTGALGDFICTLPILDRARRESTHLTVIAPARFSALFQHADEWIDSDGPETTALFAGKRPLNADLGIAWTATGAETLRQNGALQVAAGSPLPPGAVHILDHLWTPLAPLWGPRSTDPRLAPSAEAIARLRARGGPPRPLVIAPGSGGAAKRRALAWWRELAERWNGPSVWVSGPVEAGEIGWGSPHWQDVDLSELIALAASCFAWVGPDSGPSHLAAAAGARVGVLFNEATNPDNWAPPRARVFDDAASLETWVQWIAAGRSLEL